MTIAERVAKLKNYTENDHNVRLRRVIPTLKKLAEQKKRGTYRQPEALDDFKYVADGGAKNYGKEFGVDWKSLFTDEVRNIAAREWLAEFETEHPKGAFDLFLT